MTIHIANLRADMLTNHTVVQLHVKVHRLCDNLQTLQLFMESMAIPRPNLGTYMLTNPTVVRLHVVHMSDSIAIYIANLDTEMFTNPTVV